LDQWDILNKGWFQTPKKAATRYKKMDTGNRLKLIHDCLAEAIGVDDSHFFALGAMKAVAQEFQVEPQVHVFISRMQHPRDPVGI
jgi:Holliday junction resolvase RusA-like endonuclease